MWAENHEFKPWKQLLAEIQDKTTYNWSLWSDNSSDPAHSKSFSAPSDLLLFFSLIMQLV